MYFSLFTTLAFLAFSQAASFQGVDDYWSFDVGAGKNADWMSNLADDTPLSSLSIPGTHGSASSTFESPIIRTQSDDLVEQLKGGIRYIDISCNYDSYGLMVYHAAYRTSYSLGRLLRTVNQFLDRHPRETIILRIQTDTHPKFINKRFEDFMTSTYYKDDISRLYSRNTDEITTVPTLGEIRGKIFILQDFKTSPPGRYGLPWNSDTVSSYSKGMTVSTLFLKSVWASAQSHLKEAPLMESNKLHITYTTASSGVNPINLAARNSPNSGMNKLLGEYLSKNKGECFGIIVMDFPGQHLVQQILKLNEKYLSLEPYDDSENEADATTVDGASRDVAGDEINPSTT